MYCFKYSLQINELLKQKIKIACGKIRRHSAGSIKWQTDETAGPVVGGRQFPRDLRAQVQGAGAEGAGAGAESGAGTESGAGAESGGICSAGVDAFASGGKNTFAPDLSRMFVISSFTAERFLVSLR